MTKKRMLAFAAILPIVSPLSPLLAAKHNAKPEAGPAAATIDPGPAKSLGGEGAWNAYLAQNKNGKVCYLVGEPQKSPSAGMKRKRVMAMVTHRTTDNVSNVVSFEEGYSLAEGSDVTVEIGPEKYPLFAKDDTAWARTSELDRTIVGALAKGKAAIVKATPVKGHPTADVYSLAGFSKALALIDKACDVKR